MDAIKSLRNFMPAARRQLTPCTRTAEGAETAPQGHSAFTLVELLVVIAVIVILIALLLPAISISRASSRQRQCACNLRHVAASWAQAAVRKPVRGPQWPQRLGSYVEGATNVLFCPDDTTRGLASSYAMHDFAWRYVAQDAGRIVFLDHKQIEIKVVGKTVAQLDTEWTAQQAPRHFGKVNVALVDGRVDAYEPRKIDPKYCDYFVRYWRPLADSNVNLVGCVNSGDPPPAIPGGTTATSTSSTSAGGTATTSGTTTGGTTTGATTGGTTTGATTTTTTTTTGGTSTGSSPPGCPPAVFVQCPNPNGGTLAGLVIHHTFDDPTDLGADTSGLGNHSNPTINVKPFNDTQRCQVANFQTGQLDPGQWMWMKTSAWNTMSSWTISFWYMKVGTQGNNTVVSAPWAVDSAFLWNAMGSGFKGGGNNRCSRAGIANDSLLGQCTWRHWAIVVDRADPRTTNHDPPNTQNNNKPLVPWNVYIDGQNVGGYDCQNFTSYSQADWHGEGNYGSWPDWQYSGYGGPWVNLNLLAGTPLFGGWVGVPPQAGFPGTALNGLLDDLRVYNRGLSPAEILTLFQSTRHN